MNTYFIFNKNEDYEDCYHENIAWNDGRISISAGEAGEAGEASGYLFSQPIDSGESGTMWDRVIIDGGYNKDSYFTVGFYCMDSVLDMEECMSIIRSEGYTLPDKLGLIKRYLIAETTNGGDILLHNAEGRYLFFRVDFFGQSKGWPFINSIKISFPYDSITKYLPEIYRSQENDFLRGYLGIFSSMFFDLEEDIRKVTQYLDPDVAEYDILLWLGDMLSIEECEIWNEGQLRRLIRNAVSLYKKKGTAEGLGDIIEIITLTRPYIVESYKLRKYRYTVQMRKNMDALYGSSPYRITVIIDEKATHSQKEFKALERIISYFVPVNIEHVLVKMKNMVLLDHYTYLGVNSYINGYNDIVIDESVQLSFVKIGK